MSKNSNSITCRGGLEDLHVITSEILRYIGSNSIVLLRGDLASGKTTLVQQIAKVLHVDEVLSSPTFGIVNEYEKINHYDIYQSGINGFLANGLMEKLEEQKYHLIEWGDAKLEKILKTYGYDYAVVDITTCKDKRKYKVTKCTN